MSKVTQYIPPETKIVNVKFQDCDVYCAGNSKWHNPYVIGRDGDRNQVIEKFATHLIKTGLIDQIEELRGKVLGCHCRPQRCHLDVIVDILEETRMTPTQSHEPQGRLF